MKLNFIPLVLLFILNSNAQVKEYKFREVSKEEIEQVQHPIEKDAEAAILYKKERVFYDYDNENGFRTIRDAHYRIKVYKALGLDWGTLQIPMYTSRSGEENISSIKGYTYNIDNGQVTETKLKKEGIFKENVSKYRNRASIAMPEVREGSVIDIEYRVVSDFAGYIDDFRFQYGIPVNIIDVNVEIPQYLIFKKYNKGFYPIDLKQSKKNRKIAYLSKGGRNWQKGETNQVAGSNINRNLMDFEENVYTINAENIPSLKQVDFTDNIDNYRSALKFELASIQFPNSPIKNYSLSWDDVAESIYKYDNFGGEFNKVKVIRDIVDNLSLEYSETNSLAQKIYEHVRDKMTWNGNNGYTCESGIKKAYEEQKGNVGDINLMLTAMLRYAGLKANPVLISTKSHGIPLFPTNEGFNYVVSAIENDGSYLLLDATERMGSINILPTRALNWKGRLIRENGSSEEIDLTPKIASKKIVFLNAKIAEDGSISGKIRNQNIGHFAYDYRKALKNSSADEASENIQDGYLDMDVEDLVLKNQNECYKPLIESYSFFKENETELISEKIYFKPGLFLAMKESPFKMEERQYPIDFVYPKYEKTTVNIVIPEGYKVEFLPENLAIGLPDGLGKFSYAIKPNGNQLQFSCTTEINKAIVSPNYYASLREFYNQMVIKNNEKVVLSKI